MSFSSAGTVLARRAAIRASSSGSASKGSAGGAAGGVYIVGAKRTPFGAFGGALKDVTAVDLAVVATKAALAGVVRSAAAGAGGTGGGLDPKFVQACYVGNVIGSGPDAAYVARHVAIRSGCSFDDSTALTVNRLCGSGFETVVQASNSILLGDADICLAAGTEQMSQAPLQVRGTDVRWGTPFGNNGGLKLRDALWDGLTDTVYGDALPLAMGTTAETLAAQYGINRQQCDEYAVRSQQLWAAAHAAGVFAAELAPVTVTATKKNKDGVVDHDEHPRPETRLDKIAALKPVFLKDVGVVTAANASGICDGAGCLVVASEQAVALHNVTPLCRVVSSAVTGCDPKIMGIGPVRAIQTALAKAGLTLADMDRVEINEAFAAQFLACQKELGLDMDKTNVHGGAIALGHPLGASGSRILAHLAHQFAANPSHRYHVGAACIGGGQGIAVILERC